MELEAEFNEICISDFKMFTPRLVTSAYLRRFDADGITFI